MKCIVCGSSEFVDEKVLWPQLVETWGLSVEEEAYIDRQQGTRCAHCGNNLRAQALASAILSVFGTYETFETFVGERVANRLEILSINTCGTLHKYLSRLRKHNLVEYPEQDMANLSIDDNTYDLVLHSDSLEHVEEPLQALAECKRVLKPDGVCIYTIPIVVGRFSRSTVGKETSYHGDPSERSSDWVVRTEYGSDAWKDPIKAGFRSCTMHCFEYPCAFALICKN
jgi:SAM-dependent methyltransferase